MVMDEKLHYGHRERVRRRVQNEGLRALEPHEVIEFLLCYALPRQDVNAAAHRLIETFGNVSGVLGASPEELKKVTGIGDRTAAILAQIGKTVDACRMTDIEDRIFMGRFDATLSELRSFENDVQKPSAYLMCLDMESRLLFRREITPSLSWGEPETLRETIADILSTRARYAIIALYGAYEVGAYDITCARKLAYVLHECGVTLMDVILLSASGQHSMRIEGLIPELDNNPEALALCEGYQQRSILKG